MIFDLSRLIFDLLLPAFLMGLLWGAYLTLVLFILVFVSEPREPAEPIEEQERREVSSEGFSYFGVSKSGGKFEIGDSSRSWSRRRSGGE